VGFFFEGGDAGGGFFIQPDAEGAGVFVAHGNKCITKLTLSSKSVCAFRYHC
jgi:hypothetical protein